MSPRRWAWLGKVIARMASPNADFRVYPEMRFKHRCYSIAVTIPGRGEP